jgi:hypothetical protein
MALQEPHERMALQAAVDARYPAPAAPTAAQPPAPPPQALPTQEVIKLKREATQDISPNSKKANLDLDRVPSSIKTILYTVGLISGDILTITERKKGLEPPFLAPIATLFRNSDAHMKESAKTDFFAYERRPNDPNRVMEYVNKNRPANPFRRLLFVNNTEESENSLDRRQKIGRRLANFINHPATQALFRYPAKCTYGGDITPPTRLQRPYLSDYLTIKDTFEFLTTEPFYDKTVVQISQQEPIMALYFRPQVRSLANDFANNRTTDGSIDDQGMGPSLGDYDDLPP